jgi:hypothetical protein
MRKFTVAAVAVLAIAGTTAVYAQYSPWIRDHMHHMRMTPEDRAAFLDARIAAVHAGLKLNADQERLWPPVEAAVRDFAKIRMDRSNAKMNGPQDPSQDGQNDENPVARLRDRAEMMAASAEAMKKIADAADPLYKTLDDAQRRRLAVLTHHGRFGGGEGWRHRWMERGFDRDHWRGRDGDNQTGERL